MVQALNAAIDLAGKPTAAEMLQALADHARALTGADYAVLGVIHPPAEGATSPCWVVSGLDSEDAGRVRHALLPDGRWTPEALGAAGAVDQGRPMLLPVPSPDRSGPLGTLYLAARPGRSLRLEERAAVRLLVQHAAVAVARVQATADHATEREARHSAELALQMSDQRLRMVAEHRGEIVLRVRLGRHGGIEYINRSGAELLGYQPSDLYDDPSLLVRAADPAYRSTAKRLFREAQSDAGAPVLLQFHRRDGAPLWLEFVMEAMVENGLPVALQGVGRDVTERVDLQQQLEDRDRKYLAVVDNIDEVIYQVHVGPGGKTEELQFISGAVEDVLGRSAEAFLDDPDLWRQVVHHDDIDIVVRSAQDTLTHGAPSLRTYRIDGGAEGWRWIEDRIIALLGPHGEVTGYQGTLRDITDQKRTQETLERLALFDSLTGLPNRLLFHDRLKQALLEAGRYRWQVGVLLLDMNEFKMVNDSYGHPVGDLLLQQVALRLQETLRESDTVARLGGDEFAVILPHITSVDDAVGVAERIGAQFVEAFHFDDVSVRSSVSIGIATAPEHGRDSDGLLRQADIAMYVAKRSGVRFTVFDRSYAEPIFRRAEFIAQIGDAIRGEQLLLQYQPQVSFDTASVEWVEALIRWRHPTRGLMNPGEFLGYLDHSPMLDQVTRWVLQRAVHDAGVWQGQGMPVGVAVNLPPRALRDTEFPSWLQNLLQQHQFPPGLLKLELTEAALTADPVRVPVVLRMLRDLGVCIAVDDFGIGSSGVAYLRKLPLQQLKIDREFVGDMLISQGNAAIVKVVIDMAHQLGLEVLAQGVEDVNTLEALRALDCDCVQGYVIAHPLDVEALTPWLLEWRYALPEWWAPQQQSA